MVTCACFHDGRIFSGWVGNHTEHDDHLVVVVVDVDVGHERRRRSTCRFLDLGSQMFISQETHHFFDVFLPIHIFKLNVKKKPSFVERR